MRLKFWKISAAGNDFVMVTGKRVIKQFNPANLAQRLCERHFGIGADGLIIVNKAKDCDFVMHYYNADGSGPIMCGNGARAAVLFAHEALGLHQENYTFLAPDGKHYAKLNAGQIQVTICQPQGFETVIIAGAIAYLVDTGAPHLVLIEPDKQVFESSAPGLRRQFDANVNALYQISANDWQIRTWERGVEGETLACGTGATAAAYILHAIQKCSFPVKLHAPGGQLTITRENDAFWLAGPTQKTFQGQIELPNLEE